MKRRNHGRAKIAQGTETVFEAGIAALEATASMRELTVEGEPPLAVTHMGHRPGPLVLFLHGIGGNKGSWRQQLASAALSHEAAALDFRGYGGSALGAAQTAVR